MCLLLGHFCRLSYFAHFLLRCPRITLIYYITFTPVKAVLHKLTCRPDPTGDGSSAAGLT